MKLTKHKIKKSFERYSNQWILVAALLLLYLIFYIFNPNFISSYNLLSIGQSLTPYLIMALGVTFVIATGGIDLSIGTTCIAAAAIAGKIYTSTGCSLWLTIPVMLGVGILVGYLNGFLIAKLRLPAFIATLGTMMLTRGLSAVIVQDPNIFFPGNTGFNKVFSNAGGFPVGILWCLLFIAICWYLMNKNKIGRYLLAIGSNEEATRLSGIRTRKYKWIAYIISGAGAGLAAIFWAAAFPTITAAGGNGMELDAIAGVYIGGTSAAGGVASIIGTGLGSLMLVTIRSGLNFMLARFNIAISTTYVTYILTGVIVVCAVMLDVFKTNKKDSGHKKVTKASDRKKNSKIKAILISVLGILVVIGSVVGVTSLKNNSGDVKTIAVIARGENHAFWQNVKKGAEAAGEKYGYEVTLRGPATETSKDLPNQIEMAETALTNGCDAMVIAANGEGFSNVLEIAYDKGIPVVEFDSGVWSGDKEALEKSGKNPIVSFVVNDDYGSGVYAAEQFYNELRDDIIGYQGTYVVGAIQHGLDVNATNRGSGFVDRFNELVKEDAETRGKVEVILEAKPDSNNNAYKDALEALYEKGANAIYMSNEGVVKDVYDAISTAGAKYDDILFCGFDAGTKQIQWMTAESGPVLVGSVGQDSYAIGYNAVEQAVFAIEGKTVTEKITTEGFWWNKDNLEEMQEKGVAYDG